LLSRRFDRTQEGKRIHFASAMTLLGLEDGDNATNGHGYLDIVDFILQNCTDVECNLQELYRRVAFNICIGNSDDHFRNHGFLLTAKGWTLSPAYDMNPTLNAYQSLLISADSNKANLNILFGACEDYMLNRKTAEKIVSEVIDAVKNWRGLSIRMGLSKREMDMFARVLDERIITEIVG
jgi:serine/threonine-protein kinase HipA